MLSTNLNQLLCSTVIKATNSVYMQFTVTYNTTLFNNGRNSQFKFSQGYEKYIFCLKIFCDTKNIYKKVISIPQKRKELLTSCYYSIKWLEHCRITKYFKENIPYFGFKDSF